MNWTDEEKKRAMEAICDRIALGEFLTQICNEPGMPGRTTFYRWCRSDEDLDEMYRHAREDQMHGWAEEIVMVSDRIDKDGPRKTPDSAVQVNRDRLRIDSRKFVMAKMHPKLFGDKTEVEHSGKIVHVKRIIMQDMRFDEDDRFAQQMMEEDG